MGKWCYDETKGKHISVAGQPAPQMTEAEAELFKFVRILEEQIERLDKQCGPADSKD